MIENIRELDAGEISSFGLLVTFYLGIWKVRLQKKSRNSLFRMTLVE